MNLWHALPCQISSSSKNIIFDCVHHSVVAPSSEVETDWTRRTTTNLLSSDIKIISKLKMFSGDTASTNLTDQKGWRTKNIKLFRLPRWPAKFETHHIHQSPRCILYIGGPYHFWSSLTFFRSDKSFAAKALKVLKKTYRQCKTPVTSEPLERIRPN